MVHLHNEMPCSRKKEAASTLCDSMDGHGEHYANEISQALKDKTHMSSPIGEPNQQNK